MKFCTGNFNVKKGVQKFNSTLMSGFSWKVISLPLLQILSSPIFSESFITTVTRKLYSIAIISCLDPAFDLFLQHESFFDANTLPNFLRLPRVNLLTSASFCYKRKTKKTRLQLGSSWNQQDLVVNGLFSHLSKQLFYST